MEDLGEAELINEGDVSIEDYADTPLPPPQTAVVNEPVDEIEVLLPPQALFKPIEHHPLHIFVSIIYLYVIF